VPDDGKSNVENSEAGVMSSFDETDSAPPTSRPLDETDDCPRGQLPADRGGCSLNLVGYSC
jgi:hypothetical protein